jgi:hydroxymethylpyrimidine pyrophosphatase-like HAD family hydrolase
MSIRLIAFDLDGTLTQHKTPLSREHREILFRLREKYRLLMVGAGQCRRIFAQMERFPIDVIGNYGMQYARYDGASGELDPVYDVSLPCDRDACERRVAYLRKEHGLTRFAGDSVEYHPSGCVTFPLIGTAAKQEDKLAFDPDRSFRRTFYDEVREMFPEYNVFIGGSTSFDMAPKPYDKYYALDRYCAEAGIAHGEALFVGDDYGVGGNDESVYRSDFGFLPIDDYRTFPDRIAWLL